MSLENYFTKLPKDAPLPISRKPNVQPAPAKKFKRGPGRPAVSVQLCPKFFSRLSVLLAIRYGKFVVLCRITPPTVGVHIL